MIREFVCDLFDCKKEVNQENERLFTELEEAISNTIDCNINRTNLQGVLKETIQERDLLITENAQLEVELNDCVQAYRNPTNVPEKTILYPRNVWLGESKGWITKSISVRNFITVNDDKIINEIKNRGLFMNSIDDLHEIVPKINAAVHENYKYAFDDGIGFKENWWFPFELDTALANNIGGDCEDYAHKMVSWMRVGGVPADHIFVSCGRTRMGFGHSTVYVKDLNGEWRHINSTSKGKNKNSLLDFPLKNDPSNLFGISKDNFWFSFNDKISVQRFDTAQAERYFDEEKAMRQVLFER